MSGSDERAADAPLATCATGVRTVSLVPHTKERAVDARPLVLAVAAWAGVWVCTSRSLAGIIACAAIGVIVGVVCLWRRAWLGLAIGAVILACLPCAALRTWVEDRSPIAEWAAEGAIVTIEGRIGAGHLGQARFGGPWWSVPATVLTVDGRGETWRTGVSVQVIASGDNTDPWRATPPGSLVRATVRLAPADGTSASQAFARAREPPVILAPPSWIDQAVERLHEGLRASVAGMADGPRQLVPALVVGDTSAVSDEMSADFKITALTHLMAVSGANLTILLGFAMAIAVRVGARGWWLRIVSVVAVVFFVVLCRGEPSVLRAAAMGAVGLSALGWGRTGQGLRFLSWAVVALVLIDPWLSRSAGFALSVAATAGIVWWARPWAAALSAWVPLWLAEALCVPLAAQVATQPIVTAISGQVSVVGLVANMLAAPLVAPATVLGFLATALAPVSVGLAAVPGTVAGWFAQGLCWIAEWGARMPGAAVSLPVDPVALALVGVVCLGLVLVLPAVWARWWVALGLVIALVVAIVHPPAQPGWPPTSWQLVSCDVGQGDATVLNAGGGAAVLVDTGPDPDLVDACLRTLGVATVVLLVLTHPHADHIGGVAGVRRGRSLGEILAYDADAPDAWAGVWRLTDGVPHDTAAPGTTVTAGAVTLDIVSAKPPGATQTVSEGESSDENDSSLVLHAHVGDLDVVLAGDVQEDGQRAALATGRDLHADVVLIPHHGSAHQDRSFLAATGAPVALISVGANNSYGHPAPSLLRLTGELGMHVFRTDVNGSLAVTLADSAVQVTVQRSPP